MECQRVTPILTDAAVVLSSFSLQPLRIDRRKNIPPHVSNQIIIRHVGLIFFRQIIIPGPSLGNYRLGFVLLDRGMHKGHQRMAIETSPKNIEPYQA